MRIKKSSWKFPYNLSSFYIFKKNIQTMERNITLTSKFLYKKLKCYKGKVVGTLEITNQHLGHKFGEFFVTKVLGERVAYRKRLKLLLKKQKNKLKNKKK